MKKTFEKTGVNGTFYGCIEIMPFFKTQTVYNPQTHDDDEKSIKKYRIICSFMGATFYDQEMEEGPLLSFIENYEKLMKNKLEVAADSTPQLTFEDKLRDKGYK